MRARDEPRGIGDRYEKAAAARYLMAVAMSLLALLVAETLLEGLGGSPLYSTLIGATAVVVWYGGLGPALLAVVVCWGGAFWLLVEPRGELAVSGKAELGRWLASCAVALVVVVVGQALRHGRRRAMSAATVAEADLRSLEAFNDVAAALAASVSSTDVAAALTTRGAALVDASGAAVALLDGDELVLEQPTGIAERMPEQRIPLERSTLLARAVREGALVRAEGRDEIERLYPDTASMMPSIGAAIAVPLRAAGEVLGALGFVFERDRQLRGEQFAYAATMAGLAEQALERARLYERERATRQALDRILEVAPRFRVETAAEAASAICREARTTFGADFGVLWRIRGDRLELMAVDPPHEALEPGQAWPLADFTDLREAVSSLRASFVPDVLDEAEGSGLELIRKLGVRSSLRTPIVLGGQAQLLLSLSWQVVVAEPDRSTLAIVRRFADQAALALEELERRRAEADAARRAEAMRRLQSLTAALSNALTRADVGDAAVHHARDAVGADGAAVGLVDDRTLVRLVSWSGYSDEEAETLQAGLASIESSPLEGALRRSATALYESREELVKAFPDFDPETVPRAHEAFLFCPLVAGRRLGGLLLLSWSTPSSLSADDLAYLESLASQVAQALERATHFESEQTIAETLQRSVLPVSLPRVDGVQLAARYLPGSAELAVGGDWFDALTLPDGRVGLVVGDVVGKGVYAAASMGQLRNALRAFSVDRLKPAGVLARLNRLAEEVLDTTFATIVYVALEPASGVARIASAGHPPPVIRYPDGRVELLEGARGLPLGTGLDVRYRQDVVQLPDGASLLLYSDGLVERRGSSIDDGLNLLCDAVREAPSAPEQMVEHVIDRLIGDEERADDIAILAARFVPVAPRRLDLRVSSDPGSLDLVRDAFRAWLEGAPLERSDAEAVVLAVWEACANAGEHAHDPADDVVRLTASLDDHRVRVVVEDSGRWTTPTGSPDRGLGLHLMRATMSSVDIAVGDGGTRVTIEKAFGGDMEHAG